MTSVFRPRAAADAAHAGGRFDDGHGQPPRVAAGPPCLPEPNTSAPQLTALVVDPRPLTREGLARLLENQETIRVLTAAEPSDVAEMDESERARVGVILLSIGFAEIDDQTISRHITDLSDLLVARPIIVVSERTESQNVGAALKLGARGFVPTTANAQLLIGALYLVQAGGTFVPAEAFAKALTERRSEAAEAKAGHHEEGLCGLTPRQLDVLSLLRQGKPNKIIAYELSMRESTVKVHVRAIMRKLKASNRTEVVFRASNMTAAAGG